jgi:hypothetical protein
MTVVNCPDSRQKPYAFIKTDCRFRKQVTDFQCYPNPAPGLNNNEVR